MLSGSDPVRVIAHRGASARRPENTLAAFDAALADGAAVIEIDVRQLADGTPVALHDSTLERTTGDPRPVADLAPSALLDLPAEARPPLLEDVLDRYGRSTRYLIDFKDPSPPLERRVLGLVASRGLAERVQLQSFDGIALRRMAATADGVSIAQLYPFGADPREIVPGLAVVARYAVAIGPEAGSVDALLVAAARSHGLAVQPYTVNDPAEARRLIALGVAGLITDVPDMVAGLAPPARSIRPVAA